MKVLIQAGFSEPLGTETLALIRFLGFGGVRLEASQPGLVEEAQQAGLAVVAIVKDNTWLPNVPTGCISEYVPVGPDRAPEPDGKLLPEDHARQFCEALTMRPDLRWWVGGISNLNARGLEYQRRLHWALKDEKHQFGYTVHRYAPGNTWQQPHKGSVSRGHELERLKGHIGNHPWAVSEFGFCDGERIPSRWWRRLWGKKDQWSEAQVAEFIVRDMALYRDFGAEFACLYQIRDDVDDSCESTYGIFTVEGRQKLAATVVQGMA